MSRSQVLESPVGDQQSGMAEPYPVRNHPKDLVKAIRPQQWLKNGFVFLGVIFSGDWHRCQMLWRVLLAALAFCLVASGVYVLNDLLDLKADRRHPKKRLRPIAAGRVTARAAALLMLSLMVSGVVLGWLVAPSNALILLLYLLLNLAYSKLLKRIVILDVFVIALGFMLRILSGTLGVGIAPSNWLLLCGLMLTLFIGFGKRLAEMEVASMTTESFRPVLWHYNREVLSQFTSVCAGGAILTYGLYTLDPNTVALHQTDALIYTTPFVIYGIFRYLYLIHSGEGGDPSRLVIRDPHIVVTVLLWLATVLLILE